MCPTSSINPASCDNYQASRVDSGYNEPVTPQNISDLYATSSTPKTQPKFVPEPDTAKTKEELGNLRNLPTPKPISCWGRLVLGADEKVVELCLPKRKYVLGRSSASDIAFSGNNFLSGTHCTVELQSENPTWHIDLKVSLTDNNSTNGTFVNSELLKPNSPRVLLDGDIVYLSNKDYTKDQDGEVICFTYRQIKSYNLHEKYVVFEAIGRGHYSTVKKAKCRESGKVVAIKMLKNAGPADDQAQLLQNREISILKRVSHPFIASVLDVVESPLNIGLVLEVAPYGDLFDFYTKGVKLSARQFIWIFYQILSAFRYLHANNITHRDIKPENVLVYSQTNLLVKITDFGLARFFEGRSEFSSLVGSPSYAAPEVNTFTSTRSYNCACDMWSIGVMMYHALTLSMPFPNTKRAITKSDVATLNLDHLGMVSLEIKDLVQSLLVYEPEGRLTADAALDHLLFTKNLPLIRGLIKYEHQFTAKLDCLPHTLKYHPSDVATKS